MNISLLKSLEKTYGDRAKIVYYKMEKEGNVATLPKAIAKSKKDHPEYYGIRKKKSRVLSALKKVFKND